MPPKVDACVRSLMDSPKFKPKKGRTKEQSAWALCNWLNSQGKLSDVPVELVVEKVFTCKCSSCGHTVDSGRPCSERNCPECGGSMSGKKRPGQLPLGGTKIPVARTVIETEIDEEGTTLWVIKS